MEFEIKKGSGTIVGNLLRQIALTQLDATSLIAYSVGDSSNIISAENNSVLEDMVEFGNNLSEYVYEIDAEWQRVNITFSDTLRIDHIMQEGVNVLNPNNGSGELLHLHDGSISVTLYFRKHHNYSYADDNRLFLESKGVDLTNVIVTNSRYKGIQNFKFSVTPKDESVEYLNIEVDGTKGETSETILLKIITTLDDILDVFRL